MDEASILQGWLGVGTSWGLFCSDLEETAAGAVVEAVRFALPQGAPVLPLSRWAEREPDVLRRRTLEATVAFYQQCRELRRLALEAETGEELEHFGRLYRDVARLGAQRRGNLWSAVPARFQEGPGVLNSEVPAGRWVRDRWVELVLAEGPDAAAVVERVGARLDRPLPGVEAWLPSDPEAARRVLLRLLDLALMTPALPLCGAVSGPWPPAVLLPGWRLLTAAAVLRRGARTPRGSGWVDALCEDEGLRWPTPAWLSYKTRELPASKMPGWRALRGLQRASAVERCRCSSASAVTEVARVSALGRRALAARRRADLAIASVKVWIQGAVPKPSPRLATWPLKRYQCRLARTFEEIFRLPLDRLAPAPLVAAVPEPLPSTVGSPSWSVPPQLSCK